MNEPLFGIENLDGYIITVTLNVPNVLSSMVCSELRLLHFETNVWTSNINAMPSYNAGTQVCTISQTVTSLSPFSVVQLAPLSANVSVDGRISAANGYGIRNVIVSLTDSSGNTRRTKSSSFGYYRFDNLTAGETYIISVASKRFTFNQPTRILTVQEDLSEVNFVANE